MKKLESIMEENQLKTSNLEKENRKLEDKLTSVNYFNFNYLFYIFKLFNLIGILLIEATFDDVH